MLLTKLKIVAMLLLVFGAAGVGGTSLAYQLASTPQNDAVAIALDPKVQSDQEKLKQEIEQLRKELQQTKDEVQALKAKLAAGGQESKDLLYQGKPPSFWLKQLKDRDAEFRRTAIGALGELAQENRALISVLIDCLKDRNFAVRTDAAQKLALIGPTADAAVPALVEGLKSEKLKLDDGTVGYALAMIDPDGKKSIPVLTTLLRDSDELVRMSAAILLARVAPKSLEQIAAENKELIQAYVSCLIHKQQMSYIMEAAVALGAIGPRAKEALPALIDTFKKYPKTRVYFEAIEKIDPEAAAKLKADKKPSQ